MPAKLGGQPLDCVQGGGANVVLHSFDIVMNDLLVQSEKVQKIGEEAMTPRDFVRQPRAGRGQNKTAVFFVFEQAFGIEALDHVGDAGLRDFQCPSDIDDSRVSLGINQFEN